MKKKTALKKVDNSITEQEQAKVGQWFDYQCIFTGLKKPMNKAGIERLCHEVTSWASNDTQALKISQFYHKIGIPGRTWRGWCAVFPELKEAHDTAKEIIGDRREVGAMNHEYNTQVVAYTMPFYDPEWKEETARRAALKEGSNGDGKVTITVVADAIPNSPLVPERKKDD